MADGANVASMWQTVGEEAKIEVEWDRAALLRMAQDSVIHETDSETEDMMSKSSQDKYLRIEKSRIWMERRFEEALIENIEALPRAIDEDKWANDGA